MADKTIITRIQNRRGLKQDLPKPLRPGELGFATDTRQVYIGAETATSSDSYNKVAKFESGLTSINAESVTRDLANVQMIRFTVPHKRFNRNHFNGTTNEVSWVPTSNAIVGSNAGGLTFQAGETVFTDLNTGGPFNNDSMRIVKNGQVLNADTSNLGNHNNIASGSDYFFSASGTTNSSIHKLTFRTMPVRSDEIGITYYSNVDIWTAINTSGDTGSTNPIGIPGFHKRLDSSWDGTNSRLGHRFIVEENVVLSSSTGVGLIGLSPKHTTVATEIKNVPSEVPGSWTNGTLGNILVSRDRTKSSASTMTESSGTLTITLNSVDTANFSSTGGFLSANLVSGSGWLDGKVLEYTLSGSTLTASTSGNVAYTARPVTGIPNINALTLDNAEGIEVGDSIYVSDTVNNISGLNGVTSPVTAVDSTTVTFTPSPIEADMSGDTHVEGNAYVIVYKAGSASNVVLNHTQHGYGEGDEFTSTSVVYPGTNTVSKLTENTFATPSATPVISNVAVNLSPVVTSGNVFVTPIQSVDVSSNTNITEAKTHFNNNINKFEMKFVPGVNNKVYLEESESESKLSTGFTVYDDVKQTASYLKIQPDNYTKNNSTVKSKLEDWLNDIQNANNNLFNSIAVNEIYNDALRSSTQAGSSNFVQDGWSLNIDSTLKEITFVSSEETRNFTKLLNNIYFDSESPEVKGLLNVKTNIEILTLETQEAGTADTIFSAPEAFTITAGGPSGTASSLSFDASTYDTIFVEYAMVDKDQNVNTNYKRVGTLMLSGNTATSTAIVNDNYTDYQNNCSGNVEFTASISGGTTLVLTANNTLSPSAEVKMTYIKRSWSSS